MRARHSLLVVAAMFAMACTLRADTTVTVNLGPSSQNFVDFGLGLNVNNHGSDTAAQGACTEVGSNTECLMSGSFTGSSTGFTSGTYSFVTEYAGPDTPMAGPNAPVFASNSVGVNNLSHYFFIDPSTTMVLTLDTSGGTFIRRSTLPSRRRFSAVASSRTVLSSTRAGPLFSRQ